MTAHAACIDLARSSTHPVERIILLALAHRIEMAHVRRQDGGAFWGAVMTSIGLPIATRFVVPQTAPKVSSDPYAVN
jgi:hypothetical protein